MSQDLQITAEQRSRLCMSLAVLQPRIDDITDEFCRLIALADPGLRMCMPTETYQITATIEQLLHTVCEPEDADVFAMTLGQLGVSAGLTEYHLPTLLAAIQTAMAETASYTWTPQQEDDWTRWFDVLADFAIQGARNPGAAAA